ncbi:uncharacterized protein MONOS_13660 [Monocercomonoides exilis]|uniref:uncharacterized protein n=1 Tax=Monocercomonoides exilis TaxID=2049356 RepID=UPI003559B917|nr:hypothetical protein MONOS_13660 [Monocercomonoides exilis]|eukprot:MONOS_13660.1-p1 / transcript=MONOS_13660.1 / gene=MONOS_13660 / organism=Monocercomonoides_exilis_PA203 / gene_product=unspecified product / transcript_product=unspecified product / location=Mono_scaffold00859:25900-27348(+) / protein_length=441 / sequence_SO=supercontig / SO=protein_coding / is_pseudo=false
MSLSDDDISEDETLTTARTEQFSKLFCELEDCREDEQMQKIKEMNGLIDEMDEEEFESIFTIELFDTIYRMIEEKTLSWRNATLLLKHVGCCKVLKKIELFSFDDSLLSERMKEMIIDENEKKKEEKNEKHLIDLCECYLLLNRWPSSEMDSIYVPCLLKVALKKDETEEAQKEVEMALLALSNIGNWEIEQELYLNEITEIIRYHQEHHNLTRLAYQSAWQFLIKRFYWDKSLEEVIVNELHFSKEAARELEDLSKSVDWKRKEEEKGEREAKNVLVIERWFDVIYEFLYSNTLWNEELAGLINCIVQVLRASRGNHKDIRNGCLDSLRCASEKRDMEIDDMLKSGAVDAVLEEMNQSTLGDDILWNCLIFFLNISERLNEKKDDEKEASKRKLIKRKMFEKMEEEGFEDSVFRLCHCKLMGKDYYSLMFRPFNFLFFF